MNTIVASNASNQDAVYPQVKNSLEAALNDKTLNERFGGPNGQLSKAQAGLVAAVVSMMQDELISEIRSAHERELKLIAGFWRLYRTPIFTRTATPTESKTTEKAEPGKDSPSTLRGNILTWGNLVGFAGIALTCIACFYTRVYANYKEQVQLQAEQIKELKEEKGRVRDVIKSYKEQIEQREQSLAQTRQERDILQKERESLAQDSEKFKTLSQTILPLIEKIVNTSTNAFAKKLPSVIDRLETEAAKFAKQSTEVQGASFSQTEHEKLARQHRDLQAKYDELLMEKANLLTVVTNK